MTIKIEGGSPLNNTKSTINIEESNKTESSSALTADNPVDAVINDLMDGKISSSQAVDHLIEHTLNSGIVKDAPPALRAEVEDMLKTMIATDPHLKSLISGLE